MIINRKSSNLNRILFIKFLFFNYAHQIIYSHIYYLIIFLSIYLSICRTLMGHECVELRNTAAAVQCYRKYVPLSIFLFAFSFLFASPFSYFHIFLSFSPFSIFSPLSNFSTSSHVSYLTFDCILFLIV